MSETSVVRSTPGFFPGKQTKKQVNDQRAKLNESMLGLLSWTPCPNSQNSTFVTQTWFWGDGELRHVRARKEGQGSGPLTFHQIPGRGALTTKVQHWPPGLNGRLSKHPAQNTDKSDSPRGHTTSLIAHRSTPLRLPTDKIGQCGHIARNAQITCDNTAHVMSMDRLVLLSLLRQGKALVSSEECQESCVAAN